MRYHSRHVEHRISRLSEKLPVLVVTGARQTGKSTLLSHLFGKRARSFVFDPVTDVGNARRDPELFLRLNQPPLILDEVQHASELLAVIKRMVDERPGEMGQYFLTGSQQLQVLANVQESLAGRAFLVDLFPMSRGELADTVQGGLVDGFLGPDPCSDAVTLAARIGEQSPLALPGASLYEWLFRGGYPRLLQLETRDIPDWFDSYLRTFVERDVAALRALNEPHDFSRFLRLMAALTAQEVNASQLGREIGITPRTARAWLDTLVASFQVVTVNAYSGNVVKRVSSRPKAYLTDTGFAAYLLAVSSPEMLGSHPALGHLFETYVVTEIIKRSQGLDVRPRFWHWRTSGGAEVDLILERDNRFYPIEVKLTSRPSRRDLRGIKSFQSTYPSLTCGPAVVVHGGTELFLVDEDTVAIPVAAI